MIQTQVMHDATLINIFGGKITTYRRLSEDLMRSVENVLGTRGEAWTAQSYLPGGEFEGGDRDAYASKVSTQFPFLAADYVHRLVRLYGTNVLKILNGATSLTHLGLHFGGELYLAEVDYLIQHEWARSADDILWRRTKLGLTNPLTNLGELEGYIERRVTELSNDHKTVASAHMSAPANQDTHSRRTEP